MLGVLGVMLGGAALIIALTRKTKAAPPEIYIPSAGEISSAQSIAKLNAYYEHLNELYISGFLNYDDYLELYTVYENRFYELVET